MLSHAMFALTELRHFGGVPVKEQRNRLKWHRPLLVAVALLLAATASFGQDTSNWCSGRGKEKMTLRLSEAEVTVVDGKGGSYTFVRGPSPGSGALTSTWMFKDKPDSTPFVMASGKLDLWQGEEGSDGEQVLVFLDRVFWPNCKRAFR